MKAHTSDWLRMLTERERKDLVCLLFEMRRDVASHRHYRLFEGLMRAVDDDYHALKKADLSGYCAPSAACEPPKCSLR